MILLLVLWFARSTLLAARSQLTQATWRLAPGWLVLSGLLYLLGMLFAGLYWYRVLRDLGQEPYLGETLRAYFIGHLGKYVPGKAMVIILRAGLLSGPRVEPGGRGGCRVRRDHDHDGGRHLFRAPRSSPGFSRGRGCCSGPHWA